MGNTMTNGSETDNDEITRFKFTVTREEGRVISNVLKHVNNRESITPEENSRINDTHRRWMEKYGEADSINGASEVGTESYKNDEFEVILTQDEKDVIAQALEFANDRDAVTTRESAKINRVYTVFNRKASAKEPLSEGTNT